MPLPSSVLYIKNFEGVACFEDSDPLPVRVVYEKHAVGPASVRVHFAEPVDEGSLAAAEEFAVGHLSREGLLR